MTMMTMMVMMMMMMTMTMMVRMTMMGVMVMMTVMTMVMIQSVGRNSGASSCSWFLARFLCSRCSSGVFCTLSETSQLHNVDTLCDR